MRRSVPAVPVFLLLTFAPLACGGDAEESARSAAEALQGAAEAMQRAADDMADREGDGAAAEAMTAQEMQDRLPGELAGLPRTSTERQSVGAGGLNMAQAEATYEDDGRRLEVSLMSGGGILMGPAAAFTMVEFERTSEDGFERTVEHRGMKGMQEYEERGDDRRAVMTVLVNDRLLVRLEARGMTMDEVEDAFDDLDVG